MVNLLYKYKILFLILILLMGIFGANKKTQESALSMAISCRNNPSWQRCYEDKFYKLVKNESLTKAIVILSALQRIDMRTNNCHMIAHSISRGEIEKKTSTLQSILPKIDIQTCGGGFLHGAIEGMIGQKNLSLTGQSVSELCDDIKKLKPDQNGDQVCAHAFGHLILVETGGVMEQALEVCQGTTLSLHYQCFGGVFMENITRSSLNAHQILPKILNTWQDVDKYETICRKYSDIRSNSCWREIAHLYLSLVNFKSEDTYALCTRAGSEALTDECYLHALTQIVINPRLASDNLGLLCKPYLSDSKRTRSCTERVVKSLLLTSFHYLGLVTSFCKSFQGERYSNCLSFIEIYSHQTIQNEE